MPFVMKMTLSSLKGEKKRKENHNASVHRRIRIFESCKIRSSCTKNAKSLLLFVAILRPHQDA